MEVNPELQPMDWAATLDHSVANGKRGIHDPLQNRLK